MMMSNKKKIAEIEAIISKPKSYAEALTMVYLVLNILEKDK